MFELAESLVPVENEIVHFVKDVIPKQLPTLDIGATVGPDAAEFGAQITFNRDETPTGEPEIDDKVAVVRGAVEAYKASMKGQRLPIISTQKMEAILRPPKKVGRGRRNLGTGWGI